MKKGTQGQEKMPVMYVSETELKEILEDAVLVRRWALGEPAQK